MSGIGYNGRYEEGTRIVEDPSVPGTKITAKVNIRATVLDHLRSRKKLDEAQYQAGERFQKIWQLAAIGALKAMDYKEAVDGGGGGGDPLTDQVVHAAAELKKIMPRVGMIGHRLLVSTIGEGRTIQETAQDWQDDGGAVSGARAEGYVTGRLLEALDELARFWGYNATAIGKPKVQRLTTLTVGAPLKETVKATFGKKTTVERAARQLRSFKSDAGGHHMTVPDHARGSGEISITGPARELRVVDRGTHSEIVDIQLARPVDNAPLMVDGSPTLEKRARRRKR
ncbi:hypothetical protein K32_24210 [Kaistia sp. 32K]|uniref:hypothetical protein n=1 Tax=Kaistia sp. 32K TaxID=2795690 RepID=UPI0019358433|nr:hypothetical protein [Kaistia sp. 32K]BCP53804.1 hypothetical protein K32_24210 [Kaistia sp. 32K]